MQDIVDKLIMEELEILQFLQFKSRIMLYVWCKSEKAIKWLQSSNESGHLLEVITQLLRHFNNMVSPRCIILGVIPNCIETDYEESNGAKFTEMLDIRNFEYVRGITKLRDKICVICQTRKYTSCSVLTFEDQNPFWLESSAIFHIEKPRDCVANEKENCLYVFDIAEYFIWQIKMDWKVASPYINAKHMLRFGPQFSLILSREGRLLVLDTNGQHCTLFHHFYGSLRDDHSVQLPEDILESRHIVETSKGSYMIIHKIRKKDSGWWTVSEVSRDGLSTINRYIPKHPEQIFQDPIRLSLDSFDWVFVADVDRVILLDSDLEWNRILIPTRDSGLGSEARIGRCHMVYDEENEQLIVGDDGAVNVWRLEDFRLKEDLSEDTETDFTTTLDIENGKYVRGITKLKNKIYVLCQDFQLNESSIIVFDAQIPFGRSFDFETPYLYDPWDIAASEKEDCLFVHDLIAFTIWKIMGQSSFSTYQFHISPITRGMSVSIKGSVLIFGIEHGSYSLNIYGINSDKHLSVLLSEDIVELRHVVETSNGNFLIIHRRKEEDAAENFKWTFSEFHRHGRTIIHRYTPKHSGQELRNPSRLLIDSKDRVLVFDVDRVILLDSNLEWNRILLQVKNVKSPKTYESYPTYMVYDEENEQLFLGFGVRVKVIKL